MCCVCCVLWLCCVVCCVLYVVCGVVGSRQSFTKSFVTNAGSFLFVLYGISLVPIGYYIIPRKIRSEPVQGWYFGFVGCEGESSMFEGDNISRLWIPSPRKLCCQSRGFKSNSIWST